MAFSKLVLTVNKSYILEMDVRNLNYSQTLYKARELSRMLKLGLRKVGATPVLARRRIEPGGRKIWCYRTNIRMV